MKANVGTVDKVIRVILGIALLSLFYFVEGPVKWVGLLGIVLIVTAIMSWCPIFAMLGIRSNKSS
jgi:hypothetical protein